VIGALLAQPARRPEPSKNGSRPARSRDLEDFVVTGESGSAVA